MKYVLSSSMVIGISVLGLCAVSGCVERESVRTQETTQMGRGWIENESVQVFKQRNGKRVTEQQFFYEKAKCVGKKGEKIPARTVGECLKRGGKVVDVIIMNEETCRER